jgi:hypothetical protein
MYMSCITIINGEVSVMSPKAILFWKFAWLDHPYQIVFTFFDLPKYNLSSKMQILCKIFAYYFLAFLIEFHNLCKN